MLDIKFVRNNPDVVKQNIKNKFQDEKLPLVDEVIELDQKNRDIKGEVEALRAEKNKISKQIGACMAQGKKEEAEELKRKVAESAARIEELSKEEKEVEEKLKQNMMIIPNIIDPSVPIGKDDSQNVEIEKFGEPFVPDFEIPYHTEIMEAFDGIDLESAGRVAGNGFYYLMGDIARLHSAVIAYARDFMINRGFTYCVPPFMIRSNVVTGVMSFAEMDAMMYKIEGEDLYLIGTSEHSMIGKFIDQIVPEEELPKTLTSYSPCFRKEKGAHGIEERGVYRIHQFEKQEMIVVCKPEESKMWYDKLWQNTVDLFRSMDIPVRTLECCSGDLADLKVKSVDVEAWSPRQKKYFEVGSCSNLGDAQARRLGIRIKGENGSYFAHTLNNTVVAPPRMLIAFLENNLQADGSVRIPEVLQPYIDSGKLVVQSGQVKKEEVATADWSTEKAQSRMEAILASNYNGKDLDVVLCSNDSTALGVENALEANYTGKWPVITGQDCDKPNVKNIVNGKQSMSVFKDTRKLAEQTVKMVDAIMDGKEAETNDNESYDNGTGIIPSYLCEPTVVTIDNYEEMLLDSGYYTEADIK